MSLLQKFLQRGELEYTHKRLGLERVQAVLALLGHPEKSYPSVLIAGTNGKGSVSRMVESVLLAAGYPVGLYTSPHVERFTERIRVGGEEISGEYLEEVLQKFYDQRLLTSEGEMEVPVARGFSPASARRAELILALRRRAGMGLRPMSGLKPLATGIGSAQSDKPSPCFSPFSQTPPLI
jgi:dihydrofolate synthase/folylpolyglutamate synthase